VSYETHSSPAKGQSHVHNSDLQCDGSVFGIVAMKGQIHKLRGWV